ncbi:MAG: biopolymer transporter ExbD [Planctomycetota bacterium]
MRRGAAMAALARAKASSGGERINVTPLIDVVMVLIIFFLIVGNLVLERRGGVDLPGSVTGELEEAGAEPVIVALRVEGEVAVDGVVIDADQLQTLLVSSGIDRGRTIQIRAARSLPFASVRPVLDACRAAGAERVELAATALEGAP